MVIICVLFLYKNSFRMMTFYRCWCCISYLYNIMVKPFSSYQRGKNATRSWNASFYGQITNSISKKHGKQSRFVSFSSSCTLPRSLLPFSSSGFYIQFYFISFYFLVFIHLLHFYHHLDQVVYKIQTGRHFINMHALRT